MAGTVSRVWTFDLNVREGGVNEPDVDVVAWDVNGTLVFTQSTDVSGNIPQQLIEEENYTITGVSSSVTINNNPYRIRALKYTLEILNLNISFLSDRTDTFFVTENTFITETNEGTVGAISGIAVNNTTDVIALTNTLDITEVYDFLQLEAINNPQFDTPEFLATIDGNNYNSFYNIEVNTNGDFDVLNNTIIMSPGTTVSVNNNGDLTNVLINGDVNWHTSQGTVSNVNVINGALDFDTAGTYSIESSQINEVTNSSGGNIELNLDTASNITTNTGPNITIVQLVQTTVAGLVDLSEVRVYESGTIIELAGIENVVDGATNSRSFSFSLNAGVIVDIVIVAIGFQYLRIDEFTIPTGDTTLPISQVIDRVYNNPP